MKRTVLIPLVSPPISQNSRSSTKLATYSNIIVNAFSNQYRRQFSFNAKEIYGIVYYLRLRSYGIDADNVSKPLWDSINTTYYDDDRQIKIRIAGVLTLDNFNTFRLKRFNSLRKPDQQKVIDFFSGKLGYKHMLFIQMNDILPKHYKFRI